eukprot:6438485-Ditylum_brightwellii.AAC.1
MDNEDSDNKTQSKKQAQKKKCKKSRAKKKNTKDQAEILMQASPEVRQQHERFVTGRVKEHHRTGGKEFRGKTPRKKNCTRSHSTRMQLRALKDIRHYQQSSDLLLQNYHSNAWLQILLKTPVKSMTLSSKVLNIGHFKP